MKSRSKGITLSYIKSIIHMLCGLMLSSFLLRVLGDTQYGIYQTVASFANYMVLLEFGMGTVMTRNISMCRGRGATEKEIHRNASTIWTLTLCLSGLILLLSIIFYFLTPVVYANSMTTDQITSGQTMIIPITGYLIASFLVHTLDGLLLAYEQYTFASMRDIIRTITKFSVLTLLLTGYPHAILIAVVDFLLGLACLIVSYCTCRRKIPGILRICKPDYDVITSALPLCMAIFLQSIVNQANNNVDKFLIGVMMSPESVSLYGVALYIYSMFSSLTIIPISMFAPAITQNVVRGIKGEALTEYLIAPCRLTALVGGMLLFGFIAVGRPFIRLMYGPTYLPAWQIAIIIMIPMYINMTTGVLINVLDALNKRMSRSIALIATTLANIILTVFWLDRWGMIGAALATGLCTLVGQVLVMHLYYSRVLKIPVVRLFRSTFRGILPYLLLGCLTAGIASQQIAHNLASLLIGGILFICVVCGGWYLFGSTPGEKKLIRDILNRRKNRD